MIKALAERYGTRVIESEIVGLTPAKGAHRLRRVLPQGQGLRLQKQVMGII